MVVDKVIVAVGAVVNLVGCLRSRFAIEDDDELIGRGRSPTDAACRERPCIILTPHRRPATCQLQKKNQHGRKYAI
jgi:hypothetical protein